MRVLAAMSGGVDSAVAAALAVDAGHDVTGVHLALSPDRQTLRSGARGCCSVEDAHDARRVADELGIPFYVWDLAERFTEDVVEDFVAEYAAGRTPNPCLRCNEKIKFSAVLDRAQALGFDAVVTGHHARLADGELRRSVDAAKDQSYVLGVLTAEQLAGAVFPLGGMTKERVREIAAERGFAVADQARLARHLLHPRRRHPRLPGPPAGRAARAGGRRGHRRDGRASTSGTYGFTVGQRRGLGVDRRRLAAALRARHRAGDPHGDDRHRGAGRGRRGAHRRADVDRAGARAAVARRGAAARPRRRRSACEVAGRRRRRWSSALDEPQRGVAPGQSAVLYEPDAVRGDRVLGPGRRPGGRVTVPPGAAATGVGSLPGTDPAEAHAAGAGRAARTSRTCPSCPTAAPGPT